MKPTHSTHLNVFFELIDKQIPFTFIRFSDGEVEILRNRELIIQNGKTFFRGKRFKNNFPKFDEKTFNPATSKCLRYDLLASAMHNEEYYFKGIPTAHNNAIPDREFLLRLNGGYDCQMTFSDLFLNSNFESARIHFFPKLISAFSNVFIVANWRAQLKQSLKRANLIKIPDNFFSNYLVVRQKTEKDLLSIPKGSLVLSSASSLSNILGYKLKKSRPDLTFIDIGTVLNDYLDLPLTTRGYHRLLAGRNTKEKLYKYAYKFKKEFLLRW